MRQLLFYLCLLCVAVSHAEPATLENVVVAAGSLEHSLPEKIAASGSELVIIDSDAIRLSGAQDAAKALQMLAPGLYVAPKNGAFDYVSVSLQGSRSGDILWLVDGVRINNRLYAGHFAAGYHSGSRHRTYRNTQRWPEFILWYPGDCRCGQYCDS